MSEVTQAITASIIGQMDPTRKTDGQIVSLWFDQQDSSYQRHTKTCRICDKLVSRYIEAIDSGVPADDLERMRQQCKTADTLEETYKDIRQLNRR